MNVKGIIRPTLFVPVIITILLAVLTVKNPPVIDEYLETLLVDYRFKIRNIIAPQEVPDNIVTVLIDEKSLKEYGRWPWNRTVQAELVQKVLDGKPRAVAVDIFYPETETPGSDRALADVFQKNRDKLVVALGFEVVEGKAFDGDVGDSIFEQAATRIRNLSLVRAFDAHEVLIPPDPLAGSAAFGHVYTLPDRDGKLRWENLYIKYGGEYIYSLALKTAAIADDIPPESIGISGGEGVDFGEKRIPLDAFGRMHINYIGREGSIIYYSAADVLSASLSGDVFQDRVVLIGTSAIATYDLKNTPFSANMPGVEKNATVIANILNNNFMKKSPLYLDLLAVILAGTAAFFVGRGRRGAQSILYYCLLIFLILAANQIVFTWYLTRYNLIYPLMTVMATGTFTISYRYFIEEKNARIIRRMFSSYVTERVVNELIAHPEMAKLGGERREITVLFSDIAGFTAFSEKNEPEDVVATLNEFLAAMTEVIFRWEGTLDKFIGDAIVAFWGAPLKQDNHAERAVRCALHMIKRLEELQQKWIAEGKTPLSIGIGLNTGEVLVGNIGAEGKKMDYTVIGDHVNIGARVESLTRKFKTNILMTELPLGKIVNLVNTSRIGHVSIQGVGNVVVKGKEKPIKVYEIKSLDPSAESFIAEAADDAVIHMKDK